MNDTKSMGISLVVSLVVQQDDNKFFGWCPELDGVLVEGDTKEQAKCLLREAILLHLETMLVNNIPIPQTIILDKLKSDKQDYKPIRESVHERETEELMMNFA